MSDAVRHAKPTIISVNLRCHPPKLVLEVTDNGSGIDDSEGIKKCDYLLPAPTAMVATEGNMII
jgi:nitrate/nitrite-specific signal transduction histidine kinase